MWILQDSEAGISRSPTKPGELHTYYASQALSKGTDDGCLVRWTSAGKIEQVMLAQVRALVRQPEVIVGT